MILNDFFNFIVDVLGIKTVILFSMTSLLCALLIAYFQKTTLGASIYIGFCFFITVISFNKKAFKREKT